MVLYCSQNDFTEIIINPHSNPEVEIIIFLFFTNENTEVGDAKWSPRYEEPEPELEPRFLVSSLFLALPTFMTANLYHKKVVFIPVE